MKSKRNCDCSLGQMGTAKVSLRICITTISLKLSIISAISSKYRDSVLFEAQIR
jgi:hypothetical protein